MRVPLHDFFARLFESDAALPWKMLGAAAVTSSVVLFKVLGGSRRGALPFNATPVNIVFLGSGAALVGAAFALAFGLRDEVLRREARFERTGPVLSVLGSPGCLCTLVGIVGVAATILIISLTDSLRD